MSFYSTVAEPQKVRQKKLTCTPKTASREIFSYCVKTSQEKRSQAPELQQGNRLTTTKVASGIPYWPSRDPIEERGGLNLYGMVNNSLVSYWDYLGLEISFNPTEPEDVTPEWNFFLGRNWRWHGSTARSHEESCSCSCSNDLWKMVCEVTTSYSIRLNTRTTPPTGETHESIYGHEQAHIRSRNHRAENALDNLDLEFGPFDSADTCEEWIEENENAIADAIDQAWAGGDHGHNEHSPEAEQGSPQLPGTPDLPAHPGSAHPSNGGAPAYTP